MAMDVPVARMRIARELREAEHALDEALVRHSMLFTAMVTARRDTSVDPFLGHEALLRLTRSQQTLLDAGGDLARVHGKLLDVQHKVTGYEDCPPDQPIENGSLGGNTNKAA